jgi:VCBS repeat-containing protein
VKNDNKVWLDNLSVDEKILEVDNQKNDDMDTKYLGSGEQCLDFLIMQSLDTLTLQEVGVQIVETIDKMNIEYNEANEVILADVNGDHWEDTFCDEVS